MSTLPKPPWNDGRYGRRSVQRASTAVPAEPTDTTGYKVTRLPTTAAQGAGKMAPRSRRSSGQHKVQVVGIASDYYIPYELPVRVFYDAQTHPFDRPKKKSAGKGKGTSRPS